MPVRRWDETAESHECGRVLAASEFVLILDQHSKSRTARKDHVTLSLLWLVIGASILAGFCCVAFPRGRLLHPKIYGIGVILFVLGLIIRWIAIIHPGRFLTVNVAFDEDHYLIPFGPHRFVCHPSSAGTLLVFRGFGLWIIKRWVFQKGCRFAGPLLPSWRDGFPNSNQVSDRILRPLAM